MQTYLLVQRSASPFHAIFHVVAMISVLLILAACGSGSPNTTMPSTTMPDLTASSAFQVSAQALDTVVKLSWSPVPNAAGYVIHRDGNQTPLNPAPLTETTFEDIGLTNGKAYAYTVSAVDASGNILLRSSEVKVTPNSK